MRARIDFWAASFLVVALAALVITSVGTFELFDYLLPWELAAAATVVLAAGIPLLKFAATFDRRRGRSYLGIMGAFLVVELVAQYFKAQASFSRTVKGTAALAGSDLALAAADGAASRVLAFLFLASLPLVVVVMTHAAATRIASDRALIARIRGIVARFRARLAASRAALAQARSDLAQARAELAAAHVTLAERTAEVADTRADLARTRAAAADAARRFEETDTLLAQEQSKSAQYETWLRAARAELERERSRPVLTVETAADLFIQMGAPESTVRGWRKRLVEGEVVER